MNKIISLALLIVLTACKDTTTAIKTGHEGEPLPSFDLMLTDSLSHFNTKNIEPGQPFALLFVGTHCPYSRAQMENILENEKILKSFHFYIFTIEPMLQIKEFYNHYTLNQHPNVTMGLDYDYFFPKHFKDQSVPYLVIYNKEKRLKQAFLGITPASTILKALEKG